MSLVSIDNHEYLFKKVDAITQFEIARKLAPVAALIAMQDDREKLEKSFSPAFTTLMQNMSADDTRYVMGVCLSSVELRQGDRSVPVWVDGRMQFDFVDLRVLTKLIWEVLKQNKIIDFFSESLSDMSEQPSLI